MEGPFPVPSPGFSGDTNMSISPSQFRNVPATPDRAAGKDRLPTVPAGGAAQQGNVPAAEGSRPDQAEPSGAKLSTTVQVDDQHHVYYEVVNNRTGDVVCEIPPEQIRKLEEGFHESRSSSATGRTLDVRS
jgi:hypothetical protein